VRAKSPRTFWSIEVKVYMDIIVQKYGGTSLADTQRIRAVAERIAETRKKGYKVLVVVSAQAGMTDMLVKKIREVCPAPHKREADVVLSTGELISIGLLSIAINSLGIPAMSMNSFQAGISTEGDYMRSKISTIKMDVIMSSFKFYDVIILPGFQGVNKNNEITTLGRGGSDITAVALAAALKINEVEIYTDVDGVYTADPRIVKNAQKIDRLTYQEMLEMSGSGAKVLHSRSVELAAKNDLVIKLLSSFNYVKGTDIRKEEDCMEKPSVRAISHNMNEAKITITGVGGDASNIAHIFREISKESINVDIIVQDMENCKSNISFIVSREDYSVAMETVKKICLSLGADEIKGDSHVAKVSVVGIGMKSNPGVAAAVFDVLSNEKISIYMISCSEIKISCIIHEKDTEHAVRSLHRHFFETGAKGA